MKKKKFHTPPYCIWITVLPNIFMTFLLLSTFHDFSACKGMHESCLYPSSSSSWHVLPVTAIFMTVLPTSATYSYRYHEHFLLNMRKQWMYLFEAIIFPSLGLVKKKKIGMFLLRIFFRSYNFVFILVRVIFVFDFVTTTHEIYV